jgi:hypothetical protein
MPMAAPLKAARNENWSQLCARTVAYSFVFAIGWKRTIHALQSFQRSRVKRKRIIGKRLIGKSVSCPKYVSYINVPCDEFIQDSASYNMESVSLRVSSLGPLRLHACAYPSVSWRDSFDSNGFGQPVGA